MDEVALWRKFFSRREEGFMEDKGAFFFPHSRSDYFIHVSQSNQCFAVWSLVIKQH
jgi:hypothetical protein